MHVCVRADAYSILGELGMLGTISFRILWVRARALWVEEGLLSVSFSFMFSVYFVFARSTQVGAGYVVSTGSEHKGESLAKKEKQ